MLTLLDRPVGGGRFTVVASERIDGDVHPRHVDRAVLDRRQRAITGATWSMTDQVHGTAVHRVVEPVGGCFSGAHVVADVQQTDLPGRHLAMWAADCAVVFLAGASGRIVGAHAGWRGLAAGVLDVAVDELGEHVASAVLGPTIHPCCYEFGDRDLASVAAGVGADPAAIVGRSANGATALDVPSAVEHALARRNIELEAIGGCTGCDQRWFSHRIGRDAARHATIAWMEPGDSDSKSSADVD